MVFESDIALRNFPPSSTEPDITIRLTGATPRLSDVTARGANWTANAGEVLIERPGVARYHVSGGDLIQVEALSAAGHGDRPLYGVPIAAALVQRQSVVLHAAACTLGGRAVVIAGAGGSGKSTLTAALVACGATPMTDNLAVIEHVSGGPVLHSGASSVRLWRDSAAELDFDRARGSRVRPRMDKYIFDYGQVAATSAPLDVIACVGTFEGSRPQITALTAADATVALMQNMFRAHLATALHPDLLARVSELAAEVGVVRLLRPTAGWGPVDLADFVADALPRLRAARFRVDR